MRYRIACFVLALLGTLSPAFAFDEGHVSKLYPLNECVGCDLGIADLQNLDPSYANFTGATFQGADLGYYGPRRTELSYTNWAGAVLRNANLMGTVVSGVNLTDAYIRGAALKNLEHQYDLLRHQD